MGLAYNQVRVKCMNKDCEFFGETRVVSLPMISHGVFLNGQILCACKYVPNIIKESDGS